MTENVFWRDTEARDLSTQPNKVTVTAWDCERKCGTAMLPGGHFVEVRMVEVLAIVPDRKQRSELS